MTVVTNPKASRLPKPLGDFANTPPAPEPISKNPRARKGEKLDGASVEITSPKATRTHKSKGGAWS